LQEQLIAVSVITARMSVVGFRYNH